MPRPSATFSMQDDKIRIYPYGRLSDAEFRAVKSAGFRWAPKQELFFCVWSTVAEDEALLLCGDIDIEETTAEERAEIRSERFEGYAVKQAREADAAHKAVRQIADGIPFGQPILVGHHSEKRARKDAEKIHNGMRRAIDAWKTSQHWEYRAERAIAHRQYLERSDVRARRIKKLESELRKFRNEKADAEKKLAAWSVEGLTHELALRLSNVCRFSLARKEGDKEDFNQRPTAYCVLSNSYPSLYAPRTLEEVIAAAKEAYPRTITFRERWIEHHELRLTYERAMLGEAGGLPADKWDIKKGGQVLVRGEWSTVIRVNQKEGRTTSVTTNARFVSVKQIEEVKDYREPVEGAAEKVKAATKLAPIVNYPGEGILEMTSAEFKAKKDRSANADIMRTKATEEHAAYRWRRIYVSGGNIGFGKFQQVYLTDAKRVEKPTVQPKAEPLPEPQREVRVAAARVYEPRERTVFDDMEATLKNGGVQIAVADQLFPTPAHVAERMVELAELPHDCRVLEPSAGTGALLDAIEASGAVVNVTAVEMNLKLARALQARFKTVYAADFLECFPEEGDATIYKLGTFDRIIMNPPFAPNAADIKHILHALTFLKEGGRLVAICANGSRQAEKLQPLADSWEELPAGTFDGTSVRTVLLTITK